MNNNNDMPDKIPKDIDVNIYIVRPPGVHAEQFFPAVSTKGENLPDLFLI